MTLMLTEKDAIETILRVTGPRVDVEKAIDAIEKMFPSYKVQISTRTVSIPGKKDIAVSELVSPRLNKLYKGLSDEQKRRLSQAVGAIVQVHAERQYRKEQVLRYFEDLVVADKERPKELPIAGANIPVGGNLFIYIAADPVLIAMKTSGRGWEQHSSSKIFDWSGTADSLDDVRFGNYAAYLVEKGADLFGEKGVLARIMLRRCVTEKDTIGIGFEKFWYYGSGKSSGHAPIHSKIKIAGDFTAKDATNALVAFLDKYKLLDYEACKTPYDYSGYSDVAQSTRSRISYSTPKRSKRVACPAEKDD